MAIKNLSGIAISENLKEIINAESSASDSIFFKYKDKKEIGKYIFCDLYSTYSEGKGVDGKKGRGFCMADGSKDIGILSQCQSLQALLLLASEFDLDFDTDYTAKGNGMTIREIMDDVIDDLLEDKIKTDADGRFIFDASPYEDKLFTAEYSNIDAIRWVIPTFLLVLKYHAEQGEICKWEDKLIEVISYGMKYINEAFIGKEYLTQESTAEKLGIGWNFTKDCEEPSLYYTFAVCECYLSFYRTFEQHIQYQDAKRTESRTRNMIPVPDELREYAEELKQDYQKKLDAPDPGYKDEVNKLRKRARFNTGNELVRIYKLINNDVETIDNSYYGELEKRCLCVAKEIWRLVKDGLADNFFYNDLHEKITQDDIKMSTTSDALFNSVYIINTMIDAGLDEMLINEHVFANIKNEKEKAEMYLREYNELLETCQLASQKALRSYEALKKEEKEYIVDQFLIGFNERFDKHKDLIKELRKRRMRVFSLLPMLIRTNNIISEYLIRYPQANMSKYLGYIMDNRRKDRYGKDSWLWEVDGFFSASNYYYVAALGQFYSYYKTYEENYIRISSENETDINRIREEYKKELTESGEIAQLNAEIKDKTLDVQEKEQKIEQLENQLRNLHNPIEDAVKSVVTETLKQQLPSIFCAYMGQVAEYYAKLQLERKKNGRFDHRKKSERQEYQDAIDFKTVFDKFLVAYLSRTIFSEMPNINKDVTEEYQDVSRQLINEINVSLGEYVIETMKGKHASLDVLFPKEDSKEDKK